MSFWTRLLTSIAPPSSAPRAQAFDGGMLITDLNDPRFKEYIRNGGSPGTHALRTACVLRCVDVLSASRAMLPTRLIDRTTYQEAEDHPLYELLRWQPNDQHTAFEFFQLMDLRRLLHGNAYAAIVRGLGRTTDRPAAARPIGGRGYAAADWSVATK
jgi:hypothetical protein